MSRTIRVKNKHLVIAALLLISLAGLARASGGAYLLKMAERARENRDPVKALPTMTSSSPNTRTMRKYRMPYTGQPLLPDNQSLWLLSSKQHVDNASHNVIDEIPEEALSKEERLLEICT